MKTAPVLAMILVAGLGARGLLALDGFDPAVGERLERMASQKRGLAVFDADDTLWSGDVGEAFYAWLVRERKLAGVDLRRDLVAEYHELEAKDPPAAYADCIEKMAGLREADVKRWARELVLGRFAGRVYAGQKALIHLLRTHGWDVWIVSASNRYLVEAGAELLGVDPAHVAGGEPVVEKGVLKAELAGKLPWGPGKVSAIARKIGKRPELVSGDSRGDLEMMRYARTVLVNLHPERPSQQPLRELAAKKGWMVQRFAVPPGAR